MRRSTALVALFATVTATGGCHLTSQTKATMVVGGVTANLAAAPQPVIATSAAALSSAPPAEPAVIVGAETPLGEQDARYAEVLRAGPVMASCSH